MSLSILDSMSSAVNANPTTSTTESVAVTRRLLKKKGGKQEKQGKGRSGDALYNDAGATGSALVSIANPEALQRHDHLTTLETGCRTADRKYASFDIQASLGEVKTLGNVLEMICDGAISTVSVLDPQRAASFPKKSGIEWKDPLAYAQQVIHTLSHGTPTEKALAHNVKEVAERFVNANVSARQAQAGNAAAKDEVTQTRLALRSYILDCKKFVLASTPKTHPARKHIKRKPAARTVASGPTDTTQAGG